LSFAVEGAQILKEIDDETVVPLREMGLAGF